MISHDRLSRLLRLAASGTALAAASLAAPLVPALAQVPVVQPLPPAAASDLSSALRRLAANSRDLNALVDAGNASLQLGDIEAAIGFFGRADELSPGNARVKVGLAGAFVRSERPLEALRLFDEAERAGASTLVLAADRGLAYDLVGDNPAAQAQYRQALATRQDDEIIRRLALSQAIGGDRLGFEATLRPLLEKRDYAAFRTRAFGIAILGDEEEAVGIAKAVMPPELSARIAPYLAYMERLTRAQQAAAANLGVFPRAAQIGRDDPRIAQYSSTSTASSVGAALAPAGQPLGPRVAAAPAQVPTPARAQAPAQAQAQAQAQPQPRSTRASRRAERQATASVTSRIGRSTRSAVASDPMLRSQPARRVANERQAAVTPAPSPAPTPAPTPEPVVVAQATPSPAARTSIELPPANPGPAATATAPAAQPTFDLAQAVAVQQEPPRVTPELQPSEPQPSEPKPQPASVADAFAGFTLDVPEPTPAASGAVDITAIEVRREVERKPEPKPAAKPTPPAAPSRIWVQVATGRDRDALKFDWRRLSRKADLLDGKGPFVTPWGQANRLLAGPFSSAKAAKDAVDALAKLEIDSFTFTSSEGQEIEALR